MYNNCIYLICYGKNIFFTIILPVYNAIKYIERHWKVLYYKAVIILNLLLLMMDRPMEVGKYVKDIRQNMIILYI